MQETDKPHNGLTPAQAERLACLAEEMGEVIQVVGKILRFGYDSRCHGDLENPSGRELLVKELGDALWAVQMLERRDISPADVDEARRAKAGRAEKYMHHQSDNT